jgi:hypothetical protein
VLIGNLAGCAVCSPTGQRARPAEVRHARRQPCTAARRGPFTENPLMWWNFVARTRGEIEQA